jgi:hypothetical protein
LPNRSGCDLCLGGEGNDERVNEHQRGAGSTKHEVGALIPVVSASERAPETRARREIAYPGATALFANAEGPFNVGGGGGSSANGTLVAEIPE